MLSGCRDFADLFSESHTSLPTHGWNIPSKVQMILDSLYDATWTHQIQCNWCKLGILFVFVIGIKIKIKEVVKRWQKKENRIFTEEWNSAIKICEMEQTL